LGLEGAFAGGDYGTGHKARPAREDRLKRKAIVYDFATRKRLSPDAPCPAAASWTTATAAAQHKEIRTSVRIYFVREYWP